jgi:hypothetical protein
MGEKIRKHAHDGTRRHTTAHDGTRRHTTAHACLCSGPPRRSRPLHAPCDPLDTHVIDDVGAHEEGCVPAVIIHVQNQLPAWNTRNTETHTHTVRRDQRS